MPFDISLLPEKELRPWAECKETDFLVEQELTKVNDILSLTSPIKNAGFPGMSELDMKAAELIEFQNFVGQPGWMGFDEPEVNEMADENSVFSVGEDSLENNRVITDDPAIADAVNKLNKLTATMSRNRLAHLRTMHLLPVETMRGKKKKKKISSVKHNPHASFSPAFRAVSARGMSRGGSRGGYEPDLDVDFYSMRGNEDSTLFSSDDVDEMPAPTNTSILDVLMPKNNFADDKFEVEEAKSNLRGLIENFSPLNLSGGGKTGLDIRVSYTNETDTNISLFVCIQYHPAFWTDLMKQRRRNGLQARSALFCQTRTSACHHNLLFQFYMKIPVNLGHQTKIVSNLFQGAIQRRRQGWR